MPLDYATPQALRSLEFVSRVDGLILKPPGVDLPTRCVRCGRDQAEQHRWKLFFIPSFRFVWTRHRTVRLPLCRRHYVRCAWWRTFGVGLRGAGVVLLLGWLFAPLPGLPNGGWFPILLGLVTYRIGEQMASFAQPLRIVDERERRLHLAGACRAYLESLPTHEVEHPTSVLRGAM